MTLYFLAICLILACAVLLIHATRLITLSIALASLSALTATLLYLGGAKTAAVIELSVGAGLVAVLFTFANSLLAERSDRLGSAMPRIIAFTLTAFVFGILLLNSVAFPSSEIAAGEPATVFWEERGADVVAIMALMLSAVLLVSGLLVERNPAREAAKEAA
jgi:hypothetical protein